MNRLLRLAGAAAAVTIGVAACSSGDDSSGSAAPSAATSAAAPTTSAPAGGEATSSGAEDKGPAADSGTITVENFAFGAPVTVRPGAMIKVTNLDAAAHDVASDDQGKFRTPLLNQNESATFTAPTVSGTYTFSCTVHAQMQGIGRLIVHG